MQRNNVGGGKSLRALQTIGKSNKVVPHGNDGNTAPSKSTIKSEHQDLGAAKQLPRGKQLNRAAAIKAAGGRRGLSEQLKRKCVVQVECRTTMCR